MQGFFIYKIIHKDTNSIILTLLKKMKELIVKNKVVEDLW